MTRIVMGGSRRWERLDLIELAVAGQCGPDTVVAHGGCRRGADTMIETVCRRYGAPTEVYLPAYRPRATSTTQPWVNLVAPKERSEFMLELPDVERVITFWDGASSGTEFLRAQARRRGLPLITFYEDGRIE